MGDMGNIGPVRSLVAEWFWIWSAEAVNSR